MHGPPPTEGIIMTISNEAMQAAHAAICEENFDDCLEWRGKCVKAVEAAAPIIRAAALREAADAIRQDRPEMGPGILITEYRSGKRDGLTNAANICAARAAAVRGEG